MIQVTLSRSDRFAILGVEAVKEAIVAAGGRSPGITHAPKPLDPSHSTISWLAADDYEVAVELAALVSPQDIHPALI